MHIRGAFGKFLAWSLISVTDLQTLSCLVSFESVHEISNNVVSATSKASDEPVHTRSLIRAFASRLCIL